MEPAKSYATGMISTNIQSLTRQRTHSTTLESLCQKPIEPSHGANGMYPRMKPTHYKDGRGMREYCMRAQCTRRYFVVAVCDAKSTFFALLATECVQYSSCQGVKKYCLREREIEEYCPAVAECA